MVLLSEPELRKILRTSVESVVLVPSDCHYKVIRGHEKVQIDNLEQYENFFKPVLRKTGFC